MSSIERREREKRDLTQLILDGARRVFETDGHEGLSIRKVAKEIDYSPGTIYLHYKDKDALLLALHQEAFQRKAGLFAPLMEVEDCVERLIAMGRAYIKHALSAPSDFHLMFVDRCPMVALREQGVEWRNGNTAFQMLIHTLEEGRAKGQFCQEVLPEPMAVTLWSMVHGCAMLLLSERLGMLGDDSRQAAIDGMFTQMRRLLTPRT